ncbi:MAG: hypothetical protein P1V20_24555 [Verrucomicrobiales bacterium]|nr:hypothetical protein [Verrucomicrobiales bacterium]
MMCRIFLCLIALGLCSCQESNYSKHEKGFHVPEGDPVVGQSLFKELRCVSCHTVAGVDIKTEENDILQNKVRLGGESYQVTSYGHLITSIIDPNHKIAEKYINSLPENEKTDKLTSPMVVYNDDLTVRELIDLATFLHSHYVKKQKPYGYYYYPY